MLMLCILPMDMDLATLPTLGLPMEDTLSILDLSLEDFLVTMARERLMLNQRLKLKLMLSTLLMDMDLDTMPILGLHMEDILPMPDLSMADTLPIQDLSMEDTLLILDLSMEDIPVTMAKERLMLNQRLRLMHSTLLMDMDLDTMPTPGLHIEDTLPIQDLSMEDTLLIQDLSMEDTLPIQDQSFPAMDMFQLTTDKPLENILTTLEVSTRIEN